MEGHLRNHARHLAPTDPGPGSARHPAEAPRAAARRAPPCEVPDLAMLLRAVEAEVIPRLLGSRTGNGAAPRPGTTDVERLCAFALDRDAASAHEYIDALAERGVGIEAIYVELLAPAARLLGEMWEQDRVSFVDVTVGLSTLHQILFRLAVEDGGSGFASARAGAALFAPVPGESHVFGTLIVAKIFSRAGWHCWTELGPTPAEIARLHAENRFDVLGLSMSCDRHRESLFETVDALRDLADTQMPALIVGGPSFARDPDLAARIGAVGIAANPADAIRLAEKIVEERPT